MKRVIFCAAFCCVASGCASLPDAQTRAMDATIARTIPHCRGAHLCKAAWEGARDWVLANCPMKIQTITDTFIQTYNTGEYSAQIECSVSKTMQPDGGNTITLSVGCNNLFGCDPGPRHAELSFNRYVDGVLRAFSSRPSPGR